MKLEKNSTISHYKIIAPIGKGGMGEVFLAQDTKLNRKAALKILPFEFAQDSDRMSRFVREAQSASALNHPNIITIYEVGESEGTHFIATEFIDGATLSDYVKANPLNYKSALEIAVQAASALDEAHQAGIVHRDIKPDNVMIRANGLAKILDFGIVKLTEKQTIKIDAEDATAIQKPSTSPGMIIGTANYMSPEQAKGEAIDARTGIFSFGVMLYEMLSGHLPFAGKTPMEIIKQFLDNGFTTVKEIGNDAEYATADIIKAIKKGWIQGPTIIYAGKIIAPYGGQSRGINTEHERFWKFEYIDADTPDEIKKAVRQNIYHGATVIKMVTGDNGFYDAEDIKAAVDEAGKYGLKVTVHVRNDALTANAVILGGAAAIEHGFELSSDQLQMMKDKGTFLVGTDFSYDNWYAYGMDSARAKAMNDLVVNRLKRAYKIGTKMAFGTDIIVDLPGMNRVQSSLKVLNSWSAAKIPPSYILQTMTVNSAELLGLEKSKGVLEKSFDADIIALKNNPLENIENVKTIRFVMKEGKAVRQD